MVSSRRICFWTTYILSLPFLILECKAGCVKRAFERVCGGCTGPGCLTTTGQVAGLISGALLFGAVVIAIILYCAFIGRRLPKCLKTGICCHCCQCECCCCECCQSEPMLPMDCSHMSQSDFMDDVRIMSVPDSSYATKYTLKWAVEVTSPQFDIPVESFCLKYKKVEVMPDRVDGQYMLRRHLERRQQFVNDLPPTTRTYTFTRLHPGTYYEVKITTIYVNTQRNYQSFIFKTSEADTEDPPSTSYITPMTFEDAADLSMMNTISAHVTDLNHSYLRDDHVADPLDNYVEEHRTSSRGVHVTDSNTARHVYSDPPPSYNEVMRTSKKTETCV